MKILVTGGAGYIGSHTVKALIKEGFEVVIFDNFSTGKAELIRGGKVIRGDLLNKQDVIRVFETQSFSAVIHFASLIQVGESYLDPQKYYLGNLISSLNLLEVMLRAKVNNFIFSSSAAVYGAPEKTPIVETHVLHPNNPYGHTKFFVEKILEEYQRAYDLRFISLRYFNAAGADPDGELGEMHEPETHLIPNIILTLLGEKENLELYGADFPTPDGTAIRDYIHVSDLASAHLLALKKLLKTPQGGFFNLGINVGYSVQEVINKIENISGKKVPYIIKPRRKGDVSMLLASKAKAEKYLGWKPKFSDLDTIIETAWNWHESIVRRKPSDDQSKP